MSAHAAAVAEPRPPMSLNIPPEFERAVLERVQSGEYASTDDVLKACLEALEQRESDLAEETEWLRREIQLGIESAENEPVIPGDEAVELMRARARGVRS